MNYNAPQRFTSFEEEQRFCRELGVQVRPGARPLEYLAAAAVQSEKRANEAATRHDEELTRLRRDLAERDRRERLDRAREQVRREDEAEKRALDAQMAAAFPWLRGDR